MKTRVLPMIGVLFSGSFLCRCFTGDAQHNTRTHTHTHTHTSALKPILTHSDLKEDVLVQSHNLFHKVCKLKVRGKSWDGRGLFFLEEGKQINVYTTANTQVCLGKHCWASSRNSLHQPHSPHTDQKFLKVLGTCIFLNVHTTSVYHEL